MADLVYHVITLSREFRSHGYGDDLVTLSSAEGRIMRFIEENPGTSPSEVARVLGFQRSNASTVLSGMERKDLVERRPAPEDSRQVRLYPTVFSAENLVRLRAVWAQLVGDALGDDTDNLASTLAVLRRLEQGMMERRTATEPDAR